MKNVFSEIGRVINRPCVAVDLGTAYTRIYSYELGQIKEKPSLIRHSNNRNKKYDSDDYLSYLNSKIFFTPLRGGVIVDIRNAINLLRPLMRDARRGLRGLRQPISLASAPTDSSEKERELLAKALLEAGASYVAIIPEVWAAAIGSGMDVTSKKAQVLIDIGEGVTDLAIIRDGRLTYASAIRTACSDLQKAIRSAIVSRNKVYICPAEAERLTHMISSISHDRLNNSKMIAVNGNDIFKGHKSTVNIREQHIINAIEPVIDKILKMIEFNLNRIPEAFSREISESGICLSGGGACISGIDRLIASRTGLNVRIAPDPTHSVIKGEIETLNYWKGYKNWWQKISWPKSLS